MKSGTKFVLGLAILGLLRLLYTVVRETVKVLAKTIVYFGLYVPFFYLIVGCVLVGLGAFSFEVMSINAILFYIGLALCFAVAVCLFVRSYGRKSPSCVAEGSAQAIRQAAGNRPRLPQKKNRKTAAKPDRAGPTETPLIYYSELEPNLLIHEYSDRFDVFYDDRTHPLRYLRTESKSMS